jgi:hypothetical protein
MMPRRRKGGRPEMLSRNIEISSFRASVRINAVHEHKNDEPEIETQPWLELHGKAVEPIRDVTDVEISMFPREPLVVGTARPASVGSIIQARPKLGVVITWPHVDFDRLWALAIGGKLSHAHLYFTKPHYNHGLVVSASFSSELEE